METLNIKSWAEKKDKENRKMIDFYINEGIKKEKAIKIVLKSSIIGEKYKSQILHDYGILL